jgi:hypothetical protein
MEAANQAACWPVPEAISNTARRSPSMRLIESRMNRLFRSAAGLWMMFSIEIKLIKIV